MSQESDEGISSYLGRSSDVGNIKKKSVPIAIGIIVVDSNEPSPEG